MTILFENYKLGDSVPVPPGPRSEKEIMANWKGDLDSPLVSIICHTYNHVDYIKDALNGFLMQVTDFPFEIIIHDDASKDGTCDIIDSYAKAFGKIIKPIFQKNNQYSQGKKPSMFSFPKAKGRYLALCEGDDYWIDRGKIQKQKDALNKYTYVDLCIHPAIQYDMQTKSLFKNFDYGNLTKILKVEQAIVSRNQFSPTSSYFMRAGACKSMPKWFFEQNDLPFGDYFIEVIIGRKGLLYLPTPSSVYRRNSHGSYTLRTRNMAAKDLLDRLNSVIFYTLKLNDCFLNSHTAIRKRIGVVYEDYLDRSVSIKSFYLYSNVASKLISDKFKVPIVVKFASKNKCVFHLYVFLLKPYRYFKVLLVKTISAMVNAKFIINVFVLSPIFAKGLIVKTI